MAWTDPATWTVGEKVVAAKMNTHIRDNLNSLGRDVYGAHNAGTTGGLGERWHMAAPMTGAVGFATAVVTVGELQAHPFFMPRQGNIDRISFNVTTGGGAGSVARAGIYRATSDTNLYPNTLLLDGGEISTTTTGVKTATVNFETTEPDFVHWAVLLSGVAAPTCSSIPGSAMLPLLGTTSAFGTPQGSIQRTQAYGALPSTFPAGPPTSTGAGAFAIAIRFA